MRIGKCNETLQLNGELVKSAKTKSGNRSQNIAVTKNGDLVFLDFTDRTVNKVRNTQTQETIRLTEWMPLDVCRTFFDDLLVIMVSGNYRQRNGVCYSASIETQTIQYNDKGNPLYMSCGMNNIKYICENRNQDVCVTDFNASALVVVNQTEKHRFTYTQGSNRDGFIPYGLTTDSQSRILISHYWNDRIDIINQDGQFLCCIKRLNISNLCALCVDSRDNLFVVESGVYHVKKIKYCK